MEQDWGRIQRIYDSALMLPAAERRAFVAGECQNDPDLANEVHELLSAEESSASFLDSPVFEMGLQIISSSEEVDELVGQTIGGRYVVRKKLGAGGMGRVFLARDLELDRFVVIKVMLDEWFRDPEAVKRFKREVQALTLLEEHPNLVSVFGTGELPDGRPYVVMQHIEGSTLRSIIPTHGMDLRRAASILKQIGAALDHIHGKGILHRDLKPENIMLQVLSDGTELVKIVDFGIAKIKDSVVAATDTNIRIGTAAYMSPEQLRGEPLTSASDVYAMAIIAHEMVTGKRPDNPNVAPVRRGLSAKAKEIILHGLSVKPADRYQSAHRFADDLHRALMKAQIPFRLLGLLASIVVIALLSFAVYDYGKKGTVLPTRKGFDYWLMVQKMRDGQPYRDPTKANGAETLDTDDKFQLHVSVEQSGYLYIFHERAPQPDQMNFTMIYPRAGINDASATIGANQTFQSDWILFKPPAGSENFWIVWSVSPVNELESAKNQALTHPQAGLTDQNLRAVKEFLRTMDARVDAHVTRFEARQEAVVRANSDLVLTLAEFKHR
jgi:serine/threonine protein kinase